MNFNINTLFPDLEALTPDGRWEMLQRWLRENPEYGERAERWSRQPQAQVFDEIRDLATKKYGPLAAIVLGSAAVEAKIRTAIEVLQACYRERAGNQTTDKEIKNVRTKRAVKIGPARPNPKRAGKNRD